MHAQRELLDVTEAMRRPGEEDGAAQLREGFGCRASRRLRSFPLCISYGARVTRNRDFAAFAPQTVT